MVGAKTEMTSKKTGARRAPFCAGRRGTNDQESLLARARETGYEGQFPVQALVEGQERREIMETTTTASDCRFQSQCEAYKDRLISAKQKGPTGLGCRRQHDAHRVGHCRIFRCMSLAKKVAAAFTRPVDDVPGEAYANERVAWQAGQAVCCAS